MMNFGSLRFCLGLLFCFCVLSNTALASFHKELWLKWQVNNPLSQAAIDHCEWQNFLDRFVLTNSEGINLVNYPKLTYEDHQLLQRYIDRMSKIQIERYNRREQLAFWLNLYNALTVKTVANYYPVSTIQEIKSFPGLFSTGPWGTALINVNGTRLSLDDIHNRIIRPIWNDARTHYAINNATIGAPNLSKQAYQSDMLEDQLNQAASNYINSLRGIQIVEGKLIVSKIYEWFLEDFGENEQDVLKHLRYYAEESLRERLQPFKRMNAYLYHWHLNTVVPKP